MYALTTLLTVALSFPTAAPADPPTDTKTELAKWQGTWEVELHLANGKEKPAKENNIVKVVVRDDVWEIHLKDTDQPAKCAIKFALDGKVKGLDVTFGKDVYRSIYFMDGDRAVVRVGDANEPRPKDFSTSTGSETGAILIYQRVKK